MKDISDFSAEEVKAMNYITGKAKDNKVFSAFEIRALSLICLTDRTSIEWAREIWKNKDNLKALEEIKK